MATRAKDIHLEDVSGNLKIDNSNGVVEYRAGRSLGDVEINNQRGTVQVTLPEHAAFHMDALRATAAISRATFPTSMCRASATRTSVLSDRWAMAVRS